MATPSSEQIVVYVGTYTHGEREGIYVYRMEQSSGELTFVSKIDGTNNPTFLAIDPQRRYLYAVSEVDELGGRPGGAVSAYSIESRTGELTYLNQQSSRGTGPCHLSVDKTGRFLLVANYQGGSVTVLPLHGDGRLGAATDFVQHQGSSVDPQRQMGPHAHSVTLDAANRFAFVADLGLDKILVYRFNSTQGKLEPNGEPWVQVKAGAGPRHFAFHSNDKYAYLINEIDSTLTAFAYDSTLGTLKELNTLSTLPDGFADTSHCADVHVSPSGKFVYGSNRGHDSIVIFQIDESSGRITYVGHEPTRGETPRNFTIDPTGRFLLAANQDSDTIVTFRIDQQTGKLTATDLVAEVPRPVCLKMMPAS